MSAAVGVAGLIAALETLGAVFWMVMTLEVTVTPSSTPSLGVILTFTSSSRSK